MLKKTILLFALINLTQLVTSCDDCSCNNTDIEVVHEGLSVTTLNLEGFEEVESDNFDDAKDLGLIINLENNLQEIAQNQRYNWGFSSAMACDCIGNTYAIPDYITDLHIFQVNAESPIDLTDNFEVPYFGENNNIDAFLTQYFREEESFESPSSIRLAYKNDTIPAEIQLRIELSLISGQVLSATTGTLTFN